jgi:hypothetical protein
MRYEPAWELQRPYHSCGRWRRQLPVGGLMDRPMARAAWRASLMFCLICNPVAGRRLPSLDSAVSRYQARLTASPTPNPAALL